MSFEKKLKEKMDLYHIDIDEYKIKQFKTFYEILMEKNKYMNLTAITDEDEVIEKHFIDSLSCSRVMDLDQISNCIDVGTGAGFPGIPLKIMYPDIHFVLVDSLNKRINFLKEVVEELGLEGIDLYHGRAEDLARKKNLRGQFDLCVSRAVAHLSVLAEYCIPFLKVNGIFVSYKAGKGMEEIKESQTCLKKLFSKIEHIEKFRLEDDHGERLLINIKKQKPTPKIYPRKAGTPAKNPL